MDINETLTLLRHNIRDFRDCDPEDRETLLDLAEVISSRVQAIDEWLTGGGFLPSDWAWRW